MGTWRSDGPGSSARRDRKWDRLRQQDGPSAETIGSKAWPVAQRALHPVRLGLGAESTTVPLKGDSQCRVDPECVNNAVNNKDREPGGDNSSDVPSQACRGEAGGNLRNKSLACDHILNIGNSHASLRWIRSATLFGIGNRVPHLIPTDLVGY